MSDHPENHPAPRSSGGTAKIIFLLIVLGAAAAYGINQRVEAESRLRSETMASIIPNVNVVKAEPGAPTEDIVLPGEVQAWHEAPIYARTSGYVKAWNTDIGAHVKAGDVLAEIDTPEIDAQFRQAEANLATAEANNNLAQSTAKRWQDLLKTSAVSKQEADEKGAAANANAALVASARAELDRLRQLEDFKRITAPFDGVVTVRNTDVGALINAGSTAAPGQELFRIAETGKLRVYVRVPENYVNAIKPDLKAKLYMPQYPGRAFDAVLGDMARAIDPDSRTLLIQLVLDNAGGDVMPGGFSEAHLVVPSNGDFIRLPIATLMFHDGTKVAMVDKNHAHVMPVTIGRDYGKTVEIVTGVKAGDVIIINPPDSLADGDEVHVVALDAKPDAAGAKP